MRGFGFSTSLPFADAFAPLMDRFAQLHWLLDSPSGPFDEQRVPGFGDFDAQLARCRIPVPALDRTSASLWAPGVFPALAPVLVEGEFTYLIGLSGPDVRAARMAAEVAASSYLSAPFFRALEENAAIFLLEVSQGDWEVYAPAELFRALAADQELTLRPVNSQHWIQLSHDRYGDPRQGERRQGDRGQGDRRAPRDTPR